MSECFWMVWNQNGHMPKFKHSTEELARREAARLASQNPGEIFIVLQSIAECQSNSIQWTQHANLPF
jgi:hypothetical protein